MPDSYSSDFNDLIEYMVNLTILLREEIIRNKYNEVIIRINNEFSSSFKKLDIVEFADTYAQSFIYGLVSAQMIQKGKTTLKRDPRIIGETSSFLEKIITVFEQELSSILNPEMIGINNFLDYLSQIELIKIIDEFTRDKKSVNPILHLYESFLAKYNPKKKIKRGVFYTPDPIVSFIVRSVDILLRKSQICSTGLINKSAVILDPAMGTGAFLNEVIRFIKATFDKNNSDLTPEKRIVEWNHFLTENLLDRVFGFEIMINPYIIAQLQLAQTLESTGFDLKASEKRIGIFLTNTLESIQYRPNLTKYMTHDPLLADEIEQADRIKINTPISVVIGNPPYSKISSNKECKWIEGLMKGTISDGIRRSSYYEIDGEPLKERKIHLLDDYVKFIRFAQWRIEKTGYGIVAFITNHGFLSNPTFRGMRQQLLEAFNVIYILDLHGNILKGEKGPNNSKDENVFDIKQGTSIIFMIKEKQVDGKLQIFHFELWGTRNNKYEFLQNNDVASVNWIQIFPRSPDYFFYPIDWTLWEEYNKGWKLTDIFSEYGVGIVTARDRLTIHSTREDMWRTVIDFGTLSPDEAREKYKLGKDAESWGVTNAQNDLRNIGIFKAVSRVDGQINIIDKMFANQLKKQYIKPILYRPFNKKYIFYTGNSNGFLARPVYSIMKHLLHKNNLSLITTRLTKGENFEHVFVTNILFEQIFLSSKTSNSAYSFPLYLISPKDGDLIANISDVFIDYITSIWKLKFRKEATMDGALARYFTSKDIFHYIYAILHSKIYRNRYRKFLGLDFPIIPFSSNLELVKKLITKGKKLVLLHLSDVAKEAIFIEEKQEGIFISESSGIVVKNKGKDKYKDGRLYLNDVFFIDGISDKVFNFHIGGYWIIEKWIHENNNQKISTKTIREFKNVLTIINKTIGLSDQIDNLIISEDGFLKT